DEQKAAGWSGVLSLQRVLSLRPDGSLGMEPAAELDALRGRHWQVQDLVLSADSGASFLRPEGIEGDALELQIQFEPTDASSIGARVRCSRDGSEGVEIAYDRAARRLGGAPLDLGEDEGLILRIYVDRSVI